MRLLGTLGKPGSDELHAFLEGTDVDETLTGEASTYTPVELALAALHLFVTANEVSQTCNREQRAKLRGCSTRLVALGLEQGVLVFNFASDNQERFRAAEAARKDLAARIPAAELHCAQARALLAKVTPEEVAAQLPVDTKYGVIDRLEILTDIARTLTSQASANVATRIRLYGIDAEFADGIDALAIELRAKEREASSGGVVEMPPEIRRAQATIWLLVQHFLDTFAAARLLDKTIASLPWTAKKPPDTKLKTPASGFRPAVRAPVATPLQLPIAGTRR